MNQENLLIQKKIDIFKSYKRTGKRNEALKFLVDFEKQINNHSEKVGSKVTFLLASEFFWHQQFDNVASLILSIKSYSSVKNEFKHLVILLSSIRRSKKHSHLFSDLVSRIHGLLNNHSELEELIEDIYIPITKYGNKEVLYQSKKSIFISGVARSGTSALGRLINTHPQIGILVERFPEYFGYHPIQFADRSILFNKKNAPKSGYSVDVWGDLMNRYENLKYIGDKRPGFLYGWPITAYNFLPTQIKIIHIRRDVKDVALSWKARANNVKDKWPAKKDFKQAIIETNIQNRWLLELIQNEKWKNSIHIVNFKDIFSSPQPLLKIFDWLELETDLGLKGRIEEFLNKSEGVLQKDKTLTPSEAEVIKSIYSMQDDREIKNILSE